MYELESIPGLTEEERAALLAVAKLMDRLDADKALVSAVMFDSCDQYYVDFEDVAERFRKLAGA